MNLRRRSKKIPGIMGWGLSFLFFVCLFLNSGRSCFCWWTRGLDKRNPGRELSLLRMISDALSLNSHALFLLGSVTITAHSLCHLFTKYCLQMNFKATMVFHVGLIILSFSFHQKTSLKGHWKRTLLFMETWAEDSIALIRPPLSRPTSCSSSNKRGKSPPF